MAMAASPNDEEAPLTKDTGASTLTVIDPKDDPDYDEELKKYGGKFEQKFAFLQVTIRLPLDMNPLNLIALMYGFLPFIVPGTFFLHFVITRHFIALFGLALSLIISGINEVALKPICKDPRPALSANKFKDTDGKVKPKHGMPSGHVLNATTIFVWATLEVAYRGAGIGDLLTTQWLIMIFILMAPVPWARWYNSDHTLNQCLVAGFLGIFVGIAAFYIRCVYFPSHWKPWEHMETVLALTPEPTVVTLPIFG